MRYAVMVAALFPWGCLMDHCPFLGADVSPVVITVAPVLQVVAYSRHAAARGGAPMVCSHHGTLLLHMLKVGLETLPLVHRLPNSMLSQEGWMLKVSLAILPTFSAKTQPRHQCKSNLNHSVIRRSSKVHSLPCSC